MYSHWFAKSYSPTSTLAILVEGGPSRELEVWATHEACRQWRWSRRAEICTGHAKRTVLRGLIAQSGKGTLEGALLIRPLAF